jgi:hypothetical protein
VSGRAIAGFMALSLAACSSGPARPDLPPRPAALAVARAEVHMAAEAGARAEAEVEEITFAARYNPAACACPEWEIRLRGSWTRAWLEPSDPAVAAQLEVQVGRARAENAARAYADYRARGAVVDERPPASNGMRYPTLRLVALEADEDGLPTPNAPVPAGPAAPGIDR